MRVISLFAGIEGFGKGFEDSGASIVAQVEIDKFCNRVLVAHYPDVQRFEDVRDVGKHNLPACDVLTGGSPCQDLSVAGRRAGLAGERSGLFYEMARIADEIAPDWILWENVPGALSSNGGEDFACVLEGFTGYRPTVPADRWRNSGICCGPKRAAAWRVLDAQYFGVAQRRRRVFVVCHTRNRAYPAAVLFEPESCSGDSPPSRSAGHGATRGFTVGPGANRFVDVAPTLDSRCSDGPIRNQIGCGVIAPDISHCLKAKGNDSQDPTHDTYVVAGYQGGDVGHALRANPSKADKPSSSTYVVRTAGFSAGQGAKAGGIGYQGQDHAHTIRSKPSKADKPSSSTHVCTLGHTQSNGLGIYEQDVANTLEATSSSNQAVASIPLHGVRRLTPTECERLQGFPDGWTAVDGDKTPDSPRYRALGNAVCVPVVRWIAERIMRMQDNTEVA